MRSTITVLGSGYVGLTSAALFAASGYKTYIVDPNLERLNLIKKGQSFFYEEGLNPVISSVVRQGLLIPTDSYQESVPNSKFVFSAVGTPDNPDGSSNLNYVFDAAKEACKNMKPGTIFIQKSTVPVGTGQKLINLFEQEKVKVEYVSSPEFLREGTALLDSLWFDRIVFGGHKYQVLMQVVGIYKNVRSTSDKIAKLAKLSFPKTTIKENYMMTSLNSAELIKVSANAFLSLKISFANSIAKLADKTNADVVEVMDGVGADSRIGRAFLNAGRGYGGGCFPKDVSGLLSSALENGVSLQIIEASQAVNDSMPPYIVEKLKEELGSLSNKRVAVLGLSFKAGTSDTRRSPGVMIANLLNKAGASVTAYDPHSREDAKIELNPAIVLSDSAMESLARADAVIVATDWPEFLKVSLSFYKKNMRGKVFVDAMNIFNIDKIRSAGLTYVGVGRG